MDVCITIRKSADETTSIVHARPDGDVIVRPSPGLLHGKRRRYGLNTIHSAHQWIQNRGARITDSVMLGKEMCVFTLGQKETGKRDWMFNSHTGLMTQWMHDLAAVCHATGGSYEQQITLWRIEGDQRVELMTTKGEWSVDKAKLLERRVSTESQGHVFCEVSVRNMTSNRQGCVCFVDMAPVPHLKGNGQLNVAKASAVHDSWESHSCLGHKELVQFNRMIRAMAKSGMYSALRRDDV